MIQINFKEKTYNVRNLFSEITIDEYQRITEEFNKPSNNISLWLNIFSILKWEEELIDNIDYNAFEEVISQFDFTDIGSEIVRSVQLDGKEYTCYEDGDEFKLKIKDLLKIEEYIKGEDYLSKILAVVYKRVGYTKEQNDDQKHFEWKCNIFRHQPATLVTPILAVINSSITKKNNE